MVIRMRSTSKRLGIRSLTRLGSPILHVILCRVPATKQPLPRRLRTEIVEPALLGRKMHVNARPRTRAGRDHAAETQTDSPGPSRNCRADRGGDHLAAS